MISLAVKLISNASPALAYFGFWLLVSTDMYSSSFTIWMPSSYWDVTRAKIDESIVTGVTDMASNRSA